MNIDWQESQEEKDRLRDKIRRMRYPTGVEFGEMLADVVKVTERGKR